MKEFLVKNKMVIFKTIFRASRIQDFIKLEWINSGFFSNQYSIAFNPNSFGMLVGTSFIFIYLFFFEKLNFFYIF